MYVVNCLDDYFEELHLLLLNYFVINDIHEENVHNYFLKGKLL